MRSPINQGVINDPVSVGAWAEASVWENQAEAFGVGVRIVPMRGTLQVSASTAAIGERTAYQFSSVEAHASGSIEVTRYAWAPAPVLTVEAQEGIEVTRYAQVQFPESRINEALTWEDPLKVIAYSVAFPHPARGVALVWNNDGKTVRLHTRAQYVRGARVGRAEVRLLANTTIGIGQCTAESESEIGPGVSITHAFRGSVTAMGAASGAVPDRIRLVYSQEEVTASAAFEPSIIRGGVKTSWNSARPVGQATVSASFWRTAAVTGERVEIGAEATGDPNRWQKASGAAQGDIFGHANADSWRLHRARGSIQVSSFMLFGPGQYRMVWTDGMARPEGVSQATMRHLRWTPVTAQTVGLASSQSSNSRRTPSEGLSEARSTIVGHDRVLRRMRARNMEVALTATAVAVRWAGVDGSTVAEAPYLPSLPSSAVRWAGHGIQDGVDAFAESSGEGLRITMHRAVARTARAETEASPIRYADFRGLATAEITANNLKLAQRIAIMQGVQQAHAMVLGDEQNMHIFHWVRAQGSGVGAAQSRADGLREFKVSPAPLMQGNASVLRTAFKINAAANAPDSRLILIGFPDRELRLSAPDREYYVR